MPPKPNQKTARNAPGPRKASARPRVDEPGEQTPPAPVAVLFVGEGDHDVGSRNLDHGRDLRDANGVVPVLARRICDHIDLPTSRSVKQGSGLLTEFDTKKDPLKAATAEELLRASNLAKFYLRQAMSAVLLAHRLKLRVVVYVKDRDNSEEATPQMLEAAADEQIRNVPEPPIRFVAGDAVQSIEAWTLGAPSALIAVLNCTERQLRGCYQLRDVEALPNTSDTPNRAGKAILKTVAELGHREPTREFRAEIAERTDIAELRKHCPVGFAPFADSLAHKLGCAQLHTRPVSRS